MSTPEQRHRDLDERNRMIRRWKRVHFRFILHGSRRWWRDEPMALGTLVEVWLSAVGRRFDNSAGPFDLGFLV